jgi:hypothetical protein
MSYIFYLVVVCSYVGCGYTRTGSTCIPVSFKGRNHVQKQIQSKNLMRFLDQNFRLFRMVYMDFLSFEA